MLLRPCLIQELPKLWEFICQQMKPLFLSWIPEETEIQKLQPENLKKHWYQNQVPTLVSTETDQILHLFMNLSRFTILQPCWIYSIKSHFSCACLFIRTRIWNAIKLRSLYKLCSLNCRLVLISPVIQRSLHPEDFLQACSYLNFRHSKIVSVNLHTSAWIFHPLF